ncbi:acyl-CoA-binding protein [Leucosporidium creatinivorum]|uniref:Acyl-CoA-binding protein n=1 Tax=Leucosporidium creatinivorum TaxID=106004 RepID=A0A1Y2F249_9BASI|nr:acyl-CoA-binding protein [Leucosporidium creatinivorum]
MSYTAAQFTKAVAIVGDLPKDGPVQPSQEDKLFFYAHFKQANQGDNTTTRPGMLDFVGKAKWDAWTGVKGLSTEEAQSKYVARFLALLEKDEGEESKKNKEAVLNA